MAGRIIVQIGDSISNGVREPLKRVCAHAGDIFYRFTDVVQTYPSSVEIDTNKSVWIGVHNEQILLINAGLHDAGHYYGANLTKEPLTDDWLITPTQYTTAFHNVLTYIRDNCPTITKVIPITTTPVNETYFNNKVPSGPTDYYFNNTDVQYYNTLLLAKCAEFGWTDYIDSYNYVMTNSDGVWPAADDGLHYSGGAAWGGVGQENIHLAHFIGTRLYQIIGG